MVIILAMVPVVGAQPVPTHGFDWSFTVGESELWIHPGEEKVLPLTVSVACRSPSLRLQEDPPSISWQSDNPEWLSVTFEKDPLPLDYSNEDCLNGLRVEIETNVTLTTNRLVEMYESESFMLSGTIDGNDYRETVAGVLVAPLIRGTPTWEVDVVHLESSTDWYNVPYRIDYTANGKAMAYVGSTTPAPLEPLLRSSRLDVRDIPFGSGTVYGNFSFGPELDAFASGQVQNLDVTFRLALPAGDRNHVTLPLPLILDDPPLITAPTPGPAIPLLALALAFLLVRRRPSQ